jgi:ABC-type nitrate/sulfonate/bicarbonate transport system ATPase subunit
VFARLLKERKKTVVFVTHDLEEAWMLGHRVVVLRQGKAVMDIAWKKKEVPRIYGETQAQKAEILALLTR